MEQLVAAIEQACAVFEVLGLLNAVKISAHPTFSNHVSLCQEENTHTRHEVTRPAIQNKP